MGMYYRSPIKCFTNILLIWSPGQKSWRSLMAYNSAKKPHPSPFREAAATSHHHMAPGTPGVSLRSCQKGALLSPTLYSPHSKKSEEVKSMYRKINRKTGAVKVSRQRYHPHLLQNVGKPDLPTPHPPSRRPAGLEQRVPLHTRGQEDFTGNLQAKTH